VDGDTTKNKILKVIHQSSKKGKTVMTTLSSYIVENFGQETLDTVSKALQSLNYLQSHMSLTTVNSWDINDALFVYENIDTLIKVSEQVCEVEDEDLEWDMDFHTLDQSSFFERFFGKEAIFVSPELKVLLEIGQGVARQKQYTEAYWKGRYSIQQETIARLEKRIKELESERGEFIMEIGGLNNMLAK
jgi:hypothetical protein